MGEKSQYKMKRGWMHRKQRDVGFECNLGPEFWDNAKEQKPRSANSIKVVAASESPKDAKEAEGETNVHSEDVENFNRNGGWMEEQRVSEEMGEQTKEEGKTSEEIERNTNTQSETKTERPKSQASLRHSMTPLRIRDNLNRYFRLHHREDSKAQNKEKNFFQKQNMAAVQKEVRNLGNVPCSRIGFPHYSQCIVFDFQLRNLRGPNKDYALYYDWLLWCERGNGQDQKELNLERVVETKLDLKLALRYLKPMIGIDSSKFHFFKTTAAPKRKSPAFIGSCTLELMVPSGFEYDMFKETVDVVTNGALYKPQHMHLPICGVSYRKSNSYSIISIWLHTPSRRESESEIFAPSSIWCLTECLRDNLSESLQFIVDSAVLLENATYCTKKIYNEDSA